MNYKILNFLCGNGLDHANRNIIDYFNFSFRDMEEIHDWIQWAFPLNETSRFNPEAPILDDETIKEIISLPNFCNQITCKDICISLRKKFLNFLGFDYRETESLSRYDIELFSLPDGHYNWLTPNNHNMLRITRFLRSCRLLNFDNNSNPHIESILEALIDLAYTHNLGYVITDENIAYWEKAALTNDPLS